ncbi:MAG: hypothetical protein ACTSPW_13255 [Promethearchaeota archaeon]
MNKGIARLFRKNFPDMAKEIAPHLKLGRAIRYEKEGNIIYNLVTKEKVWQKANSEYKNLYYKNLKNSLIDLKNQMLKNNEKFLAMPRIGSGLDGGNWEEIKTLIQNIFRDSNIKIEIRYLEDVYKISNIVFSLELAKSNKSRCKRCNKFIEKNSLRLKEIIPISKYSKNIYYCKRCTKIILEEMKKNIENLIEEFNRIDKLNK